MNQERLKELMEYEPDLGEFRFRWSGHGVKAGQIAGHISSQGYRYLQLDGRAYRAGRVAWLYMTGEWPKQEIDHIDRNRANDRFENLRDVSSRENKMNRKPYVLKAWGAAQ